MIRVPAAAGRNTRSVVSRRIRNGCIIPRKSRASRPKNLRHCPSRFSRGKSLRPCAGRSWRGCGSKCLRPSCSACCSNGFRCSSKWTRLLAAWEKVGWREDLRNAWDYCLFDAAQAGRRDVVARLLQLRGIPEDHDDIPLNARMLLLQEQPEKFLHLLEEAACAISRTQKTWITWMWLAR